MWSHLERIVGGAPTGIGTRGPGEQQLEIDRRIVQRRKAELRREITRVQGRREQERREQERREQERREQEQEPVAAQVPQRQRQRRVAGPARERYRPECWAP
jgi:50S ribosomal subunit-associated GTPase HflX